MKTKLATLVVCTSLLGLAACGKKSSGGSSTPAPEAKTNNTPPLAQEVFTAEKGTFRANLRPLNTVVAGNTRGTATFKIRDEEVMVEVKVDGAPAKVVHAQSVHISKSCPTYESDVNKDGFIDAREGLQAYGPALIPLDGDVSAQLTGSEAYPIADSSGSYFYTEFSPLNLMMQDLKNKDSNSSDSLVKLDSSKLDLTGKQVVIYGVAETAQLPSTVRSINGMSAQASLPIACGEIVKIDEANTDGGKH